MTTESGVYGKSVPSAMWTSVTGFACRCMSIAATLKPASASFFVTCPAPAPTSKIGASKFRMYVTKPSVGSKNRTDPRGVPIIPRRSSFSKLNMVPFLHHVRESEFAMRHANETELAKHVPHGRQVRLLFLGRPAIEQARA